MQFSDQEILNSLNNGNKVVFEYIFNTYHSKLFLYSKKYIPDNEVARDLLQDVFINLWEKRETIKINVSLKSYLFTTVHNHCLNYLKHQKVEEKHLRYSLQQIKILEIDSQNEMWNGTGSLMFQAIEKDIEAAMELLPKQCRETFELSRFQGLKNNEIAEKMGVSVRTVETQLYRALKIMKERLKIYIKFLILCFLSILS